MGVSNAATPVANFVAECGENSFATCENGLQENETVTINGNLDLSTCMKGNDGAKAYGITLTGSPGMYDYVVNVDCEGPHGMFSGGWHLKFEDKSGDIYSLYIYSSHRSTHTVRYNSTDPAIVKIYWSN